MRTNYIGVLAILALACAMLASPTTANLVSTSFGFPVIVQNGSTVAFNQDAAQATDLENININFPLTADGISAGPTVGPAAIGGAALGAGASANVLPFGSVNLAFPSISQTVDQAQTTTHTDFAQTNEFAEFAYPFTSVGAASLPGFGFGF